jgi:hypothetical protein
MLHKNFLEDPLVFEGPPRAVPLNALVSGATLLRVLGSSNSVVSLLAVNPRSV